MERQNSISLKFGDLNVAREIFQHVVNMRQIDEVVASVDHEEQVVAGVCNDTIVNEAALLIWDGGEGTHTVGQVRYIGRDHLLDSCDTIGTRDPAKDSASVHEAPPVMKKEKASLNALHVGNIEEASFCAAVQVFILDTPTVAFVIKRHVPSSEARH